MGIRVTNFVDDHDQYTYSAANIFEEPASIGDTVFRTKNYL